ncbi:C3H1-type domain-containing protein [Trichoderma simmonsii]|uniref:C3H1-type domain-containing protein n=1 Tax=Trichoderma simmonsii TaxID=1491479 RepID=A0A8G0PJX3_9HYPO|nr:C3H1-type domain-containing protein [Trichoderma simmonsii]
MISPRRTWMSFAWCKSATTTPRTSALNWPRSTSCERILAARIIAAADQAAVGVATTTGVVATIIARSRDMNTLGSHTLPNTQYRMGVPILQQMAIQLLGRGGLQSMVHTTTTLMLLFHSLSRITIQTTLLNRIPRLSTPSRQLSTGQPTTPGP